MTGIATLSVLDLFSGIGGFSLGLEATGGFRTAAFCEIDPFARRVLASHWPEVPIYENICTLDAARLAADGIIINVICGGFPCQDISSAGKRAGIEGERSGLWSEYARLIGELRPRYMLVENVAALLGRGLARVLGDLAALGYDAEWHCIPASAAGAPHRRDRIWIVAYPDSLSRHQWRGGDAEQGQGERNPHRSPVGQNGVAHAVRPRLEGRPIFAGHLAEQLQAVQRGCAFSAISDANGAGCAQPVRAGAPILGGGSGESPGPHGGRRHPWVAEPDVGRVADGVSARVDRLRVLGNAVVPQIPELIGRAILAAVQSMEAAE